MAMYLGGGQVIDPSVKVGPDANLVQAAQNNRQSQKSDSINTINMLKQFADAQGISMSHMAEMFPEQMSFAFDAITGGNGADMMNKLNEMPANAEQDARYRDMLEVGKLRNTEDYSAYGRQVQSKPFVPGQAYEKSYVDANTPQAFSAYQNQSFQPAGGYEGASVSEMTNVSGMPQKQLSPQEKQDLLDALVAERAQTSEVNFDTKNSNNNNILGLQVMAQGGMLDEYEKKTGDVHSTALIGSQEMVMNKEVVNKFGNVLEQMNQMYPNMDAASLPSSIGGIPQYAEGTDLSYAQYMAKMAQEPAATDGLRYSLPQDRNNQRMRVYQQQENAIIGKNAGAELERNAASEADPLGGGQWVPLNFFENKDNADKYEAVPGYGVVSGPDGVNSIVVREKNAAQDNKPYIPGPQTQPSNTQGSNRLHPGGNNIVPPVDEVKTPINPVVTPEPNPEPKTEAEKLQLRQATFEKGEVATPAEYETVLDTFGFFPEMDRRHQMIAEVAPGLAQAIPGAKYYADRMAAGNDPKTLLELQKLSAEITKLQSEAAENIANSELYKAKKNIEDINAKTLGDKNKADIRTEQSTASANFALGALRDVQAKIENFKLDNVVPEELNKMMAETQKLLKETDFMMDPVTKANIELLNDYVVGYGESAAKGQGRRWLAEFGDEYAKVAQAFTDQGYLALSGEGTTGHFFWKEDVPTPSGAITTMTGDGGGQAKTPEELAADAARRAEGL